MNPPVLPRGPLSQLDTVLIAGVLAGLAAIAAFTSPAYLTDSATYEQIGRELVVPDCSNLHCTRVLVPWVIERLPGSSLFNWKLYAVLGNLLAALGIARLCAQSGAPVSAVRAAAVLSAFGAGSQLTLLDPHTSDPLIYALVPWMVLWLVDGRLLLAGVVAAIGVAAKEFAVAPLWVFAAYGAIARRADMVLRASTAAAFGSAVWLLLQLWFVLRYNYSYGGNPSAQVLEGGYLVRWVSELGVVQAAGSLVLHFGPLAILAILQWKKATLFQRRLAWAALPAALIFAYVQQPDRAIWNFQFVLIPLAASAFVGVPAWMSAVFLAAYAATNLPAQSTALSAVTAVAFVVSLAAIAAMWRARPDGIREPAAAAWPSLPRVAIGRAHVLTAATAAVLLAAGLLVAADVSVHRRVEYEDGFSIWGYRGPVVPHKQSNDVRVAVLGGQHVFGRQLVDSIPHQLQEFLNNTRLRGDGGYRKDGRISVVNLAGPYDAVPSFAQTLDDYRSLEAGVICLYLGDESPAPTARQQLAGWRHDSAVFRVTGYLPVLPSLLSGNRFETAGPRPARDVSGWREYAGLVERAAVSARANARVLVATHPRLPADEGAGHDAVAERLTARFNGDNGFEYLDLRRVVDLTDAARTDALISESLSQAVFRLLRSR
jgi:hypothetical protein